MFTYNLFSLCITLLDTIISIFKKIPQYNLLLLLPNELCLTSPNKVISKEGLFF